MVKEVELRELMTEKQVGHVLRQALGDGWRLVGSDVRRAAEGLTGFLGDHFRVSLHVQRGESETSLRLFVKSMPLQNKEKAGFIDDGNYYRREVVMFKLFEEMGGDDGPHPWRTKAYVYSDRTLVMPDVSPGYSTRDPLATLDVPHARTVAASLARFHASFTNLVTTRTLVSNTPYNLLQEYGNVMDDPTFKDSPWLAACAKLSANFIEKFSDKYRGRIPDLEKKLAKMYLQACDSLTDRDDTLNVALHKDLWINNIMFKSENGVPTNALLIDYQCLRYGPPAFDIMIFLYLCTSRGFREVHEKEILLHYYTIFHESLDEQSKKRLNQCAYDLEEFLRWCEQSRMFGLFEAIGIFPYVLMDPRSAQKYFDDPKTFIKYCNEDRSYPVLEYCKENVVYRDRQLETTEEFIERYVL